MGMEAESWVTEYSLQEMQFQFCNTLTAESVAEMHRAHCSTIDRKSLVSPVSSYEMGNTNSHKEQTHGIVKNTLTPAIRYQKSMRYWICLLS
jgi:hypothetical protein